MFPKVFFWQQKVVFWFGKLSFGINVYLKDTSNNEYSLKTIDLDLNNYNFEGENLYINFDNSLFGNKENEPRLTGKKITDNPNESTILNGSFKVKLSSRIIVLMESILWFLENGPEKAKFLIL